jgi:hypothetical protein
MSCLCLFRNPAILERLWRVVTRGAVLGLAGLLVSCIDGCEEYWIGENGGGRAEIEYSVPASMAKLEGGDEAICEMLEDFFKGTSAIRQAKCEVITKDGRTRVSVRFSFDSGMELAEASGGARSGQLPSAVGHLIGEVGACIRGRTLEFMRTAKPDKAIPGAGLMPKGQLDSHKLVFIVHLPVPAKESNATRVTDEGRTLCWETSLADTMNHPLAMRFKMDLPIPWGRILMLTAILSGVLALAVGWIRKRRKTTARGTEWN